MNKFLRKLQKKRTINLTGADLSSRMATEEDIYNCYRLILRREPDQKGWDSWKYRLKTSRLTLASLAEDFLNSEEFQLNSKNTHFSFVDNQVQLVDLEKFRMYVSGNDHLIGAYITQERNYEPHVTREIQSVLKRGSYFIDIGANIGYFSLLAASLVGVDGKVFAFEPNPANCLFLKSSIGENGYTNIDIYQYAIADEAKIFLLEVDGSNGHITPIDSGGGGHTRTRFFITAVVLDSILGSIEKVDAIKMDIEGTEPRALQGMRSIIQKHYPVILTEFSPPMIEAISKVSPESYLNSLRQLGYDLFVVGIDKNTPLSDDYQQVQALYFAAGQDHIDLVAYPRRGLPSSIPEKG